MPYLILAILLGFQSPGAPSGSPVVLEQILSRHDPALDVAKARIAVGRDGNIYVGSPRAKGGYVLRVTPEGEMRGGGKVGYSLSGLAVNQDGIIATSESHFGRRVAFWGKDFTSLGLVKDFLANDTVGWNSPSDVCAGASGSFYAIDQHRSRILKVTAPDKLASVISLSKLGLESKGGASGLRVDEKNERFVLSWPGGVVHAMSFAGTPLWKIKASPAGEPPGGFDLDANGRLHIVAGGQEIVRIYDPSGKPAGEVKLGNASSGRLFPIHDLRILGNDLIVKRGDPTTLFEVYDRKTGAMKRRVRANVEVLTATYGSPIWTTGNPVSFKLKFDPGAGKARPHFRVFFRPLGVPQFAELPIGNGTITPPTGSRGLYHVRVTPDILGRTSDYVVDGIVEVREPNATGSVSIFTPLNRFYYGQGEPIPVAVIVRHSQGAKPFNEVPLTVVGPGGEAMQGKVALKNGRGVFTFPVDETSKLAPGRYTIDAKIRGYTVAPQYVEIGPGLRGKPGFRIVQHGDFAWGFPAGPRPISGNLPGLLDAPETVADHLDRSRRIGLNLFVDRLGGYPSIGADAVIKDDALISRLKADPIAIAPEKATLEGAVRRTVGGYGAFGVEEQAILLNMDAGLPLGTQQDGRKPEKMDADLKQATEALLSYPAFRGWSWAANWWLSNDRASQAKGGAQRAQYTEALKKAEKTGEWSPVLDEVSDATFALAVDAERRFRAVLDRVAPGKISAMTGPYRASQVSPPILFRNADEVDLHYQSEQLQPPQVTAHNVDFYKRPGKPAWGHPELWNDDGTGGMIFPTLLQMVMRGVNGVGKSAPVGPWVPNDPDKGDPRNGAQGTTSAYRAIFELLRMHGPWLTKLENADRVAIVVSTRMERIETSDGKIGSAYFDSLFEAYNACLYAQRPASFVFAEDLKPDSFKRFKAVIVAGQRVEFEPKLLAALREAMKDGVRVFHDGTCRAELVGEFTPLGLTFDRVKSDPSAWQDDSAYSRFPGYFLRHAESLRKILGPIVGPVGECENPEIMLTERTLGDARFVWAVNNTMLARDPGLAWRTTLLMSHRAPVLANLKIEVPAGYEVYSVFSDQVIPVKGGIVPCDLRTMPAQLFAIYPAGKRPGYIPRTPQIPLLFGPHVRGIAVSQTGDKAVLSTFNWDNNLYGVDLATGKTTWRGKVGNAFAMDPEATAKGFVVQGFDVLTASGYHLYMLGDQGENVRRFALYGLPKRATEWSTGSLIHDRGINSFAASPDGSWVASAGDLGLVAWDSTGRERWSDSWWKTTRKRLPMVALNDDTLVTFDREAAVARRASDGQTLWSIPLGDAGTLRGGIVSADRKTVVIHGDGQGGQILVIRDGKKLNTIPAPADELAIAPDGSFIVAVQNRQLQVLDPTGGLLWTYTGDDILHNPRISPDGRRIAIGDEVGILTLLDRSGAVIARRDLQSLPHPAWLPDGDLIAATWMGHVHRFDKTLDQRWHTTLQPVEAHALASNPTPDATPTARKTGWGNAEATPLPLTPNLLAETKAILSAVHDPKSVSDPVAWQNKIQMMTDGKLDAPAKPWLGWTAINYIDSGWHKKMAIEVDAFRVQLKVTGITFVEDEDHPESWLRDVRLEWWDPSSETWKGGTYLLSDTATHSHVLATPIEAAKFRFVTTGGGSWPSGNIRLKELIFHGEVLGPSHPDAMAKRPRAVLFDESGTDLKSLPITVSLAGAFSGEKCLELKKPGQVIPGFLAGPGHAVANWDFEIAEHPEPGQYRYLRFAWKATSANTTGMSLILGRAWAGGGVATTVGEAKWNGGVIAEQRLPGKPPTEWQEVTVDLWSLSKGKPLRIQCLGLMSNGGGAMFDRIVLGRTEADLGK